MMKIAPVEQGMYLNSTHQGCTWIFCTGQKGQKNEFPEVAAKPVASMDFSF